MSKQKQKGTAHETLIVRKLNEAGIPAVRSPQSTHSKTHRELDTDVIIGSLTNVVAKLEVKHRKSVPKAPYEWLGDNDFLVMRRDHHKDLVVMDFETFTSLYNGNFAFPTRKKNNNDSEEDTS